ncbi:MAG: hypothetical protein ACLGHT_03425 [Acidimicrobiia bacterium]
MDDRQLARSFSLIRIAVGIAFLLMPRVAAKPWFGDGSDSHALRWLARAFGVRDALLGVGTLIAIDDKKPVRQWLHYSAVSDSVDALATLLAYKHLPPYRRFALLVAAASGAATGLALAQRLDD